VKNVANNAKSIWIASYNTHSARLASLQTAEFLIQIDGTNHCVWKENSMSKIRPTNQAMEIVPLLDTLTTSTIAVDGMIESNHHGEYTAAYSILDKYNLAQRIQQGLF